MKDGAIKITIFAEHNKVFTGFWCQVTVQLQIEVALVSVQPHVALLLHKLVAQYVLVDGSCKQSLQLHACPSPGVIPLLGPCSI